MSVLSRSRWVLPATCVWVLLAAQSLCPAATIFINEIMASNDRTVTDPQGQYDDWIEFYNPGTAAVDMAGMYVTDDLGKPTKWQFPSGHPELTTIAAHGYLLLWADGDTEDAGLHSGFNVSASGEELGLVDSTASTLIDSVSFGEQTADVSYGRYPDGGPDWQVMVRPTPGSANVSRASGVVEAPQFSAARGFYDGPFSLELTTPTAGATIYYRLDYIDPRSTDGGPAKYTGPISVDRTTCVRAIATKTGWVSSKTVTATYIFLDNVVHQPALPTGFPSSWGENVVDYEVDPDVVNSPAYSGEFKDDLKKNPSVCIVIANDDFFGASNGIYANAERAADDYPDPLGANWERPASIEWIDPVKATDFQVNAGLRAHGGVGRKPWVAKHSLRMLFKGEYGPTELEFPLFEDSQVDRFDSLVLRATWNYSFFGDSTACGGLGTNSADYNRDQFARDTIRDMGGLAPYGRHVNLYVNGLYWGMYVLTERPDDGFASLHLGGDKEDYDVLKASNSFATVGMEVMAGDDQAWTELFRLAKEDLSIAENYQAIQQYVDVQAMIDYLLMVYFVGSRDAPVLLCNNTLPRNFYALRRRDPPGPFLFIAWDVEWSLESPTVNRVTAVGQQNPHYLLDRLMANDDFRVLLSDRIFKFFFHDGALTPVPAILRYGARADDMWGAIVGESARWGDSKDSRKSRPCTRDVEWVAEVDRLLFDYFPVRTDNVLHQLRQASLYPVLSPPEFYVNDVLMHGGHIAGSDLISLKAEAGEIWYTLDGNDPRLSGSSTGPLEQPPWVAEDAPKKVLVPTGTIDNAWRTEAAYDDSVWLNGAGGAGYERSSGYESYIGINVHDLMYGQNASCYIRIPFTLSPEQLEDVTSLMLKVRYDDGFIAYLNGVEVQRALFDGLPAWNSHATTDHLDSDAVNLEPFDLSAYLASVRAGRNVLAIQGLNASTISSDFLISVELVASQGAASSGPAAVSPSAILYKEPFKLDVSTRIKARALENNVWSAVNEAVFAVGPVAEGLRISEMMYHPANTGKPADPDTEFIELTNVASQAINLKFVQLTHGVTFTFPSFTLAPHAYGLVVKDTAAFQEQYGTGLPVVGQWQGSLDNGGERVELQDAAGQVIHNFKYDDLWYGTTDGLGDTLVVKDPAAADANNLSDSALWRPSTKPGGSPGRSDP